MVKNLCCIFIILAITLLIGDLKCQETEDEDDHPADHDHHKEVVTLEMLLKLQTEVNGINTRIGSLQEQIDTLALKIHAFASQTTTTPAPTSGLQSLIDLSQKQEEDIAKLFHTNGVWQQNFKIINSTFEKLRKVVVFQTPVMYVPKTLVTAVPKRSSSGATSPQPKTLATTSNARAKS